MCGVLITAIAGKETDEEKQAAITEICKEGGPIMYWLDKFLIRQQEAEQRGIKSGMFIGEQITIAELKFAGGINSMVPYMEQLRSIMGFDKYKSLAKIIKIVYADDKVLLNEKQFKENKAAFEEKPTEQNIFKYGGKYVAGAF